tara:strand:- start:260 stop:505 length:246 start_codon:yes stop_codon:yes gene_type:complete
MEIKPFGTPSWTKIEGNNFKEILTKPEESDLIGTEDVAKLLGMNVDRVRYLSRLGRLPSTVLSSKSRVFSRKELLALEQPY